ncbi:MAG: type VI secretion system baseplate subunit TssG [Bosea sp. (in: a-proteobacteria)]|uniref:type VI secretion system baseplate subunit TssG n=1 Tax=unclassified Bosea (in: a-proteobacteria) TaxID=2653178 RepID=UPI0009688EB1|nr:MULTISPECIES: type VI secretion system baseplate subunit TssG [unclassified Bosea (in: a-proteobacteria)]MBN9442966.1 type VI secretion system baseplate subunit TssG [Bosea sp. (in: a-proteobacteria)]MBN9458937.1 type VI secretion system baseplate subunit TssG [Bosea sp. (in: a-proteobacteria)]OJV06308.1 MAG: type VI secretion protein [Bosea sp. 67-29]
MSEEAARSTEKAASYQAQLEAEPWRFDFYAVLRRLERSFPERGRIGAVASRQEEYVALGEQAFLDFPASTIAAADRDAQGRLRLFVKFLGLLGPQGALPLATTEESYQWQIARDDAFPRFLDIFNHRFLQLFYRAWADSRPIAQHDRPDLDRFAAYIGSMIGVGSKPYLDRDSVPDAEKLAHAGLIGAQAKSASRLQRFLAGLFKAHVEIEQFVGMRLTFDPADRTQLGAGHCTLGADALLGASVYSVEDKFRVKIVARDLAEFERFLPEGDRCEPLADAVFLHLGEQFEWDVELALPVGEVKPMRLGQSGQLGWTSWMAPNWTIEEGALRRDARFHPAERMRLKRSRAGQN